MHPEPVNQSDSVVRLHPATDIGTVTLKVADLARSLMFYTQIIGLRIFQQGDTSALLGAGSRRILTLEHVPGARPQAPASTGLYHAAILLPDRHALAVKIRQLAEIKYPFGYSDHLVSEAFYLSDPDGNGLELYRDRPRSEWTWQGDQVQMALDPIDFESFFREVPEGDEALASPSVPDGTKLGHMHLRVGDVEEAEKFYHGVLGFDITAHMPGALFVSAGGYHHHLGLNMWESRGGKAPAEPSAGLREFSVALPDQAELERLTEQVNAAGVIEERRTDSVVVHDPWQNRVRFIVQDQLAR